MKRPSLLALTLSVFLITQIPAQDIKYAVVGGVESNRLHMDPLNTDTEYGQGFTAGVQVDIPFKGITSFLTGVNFAQYETHINSSQMPVNSVVTFKRIEVPTQVKVDLSGTGLDGLFITTGLNTGYTIAADQEVVFDGSSDEVDIKDNTNKVTSEGVLSVGYVLDSALGDIWLQVKGAVGMGDPFRAYDTGLNRYGFSVGYGF